MGAAINTSGASAGPFRSIEEWKSALMLLPDGSFFELMRSVFGNIKTPFNKQRLMEDLSAFLSRDEIRKTIALYIDETDARVIAAIAALQKPAPGELESFFAGELSYADLHDILLNLEERFILYRFREEGLAAHSPGAVCLALNPALEPVLAPFAADLSVIFPSSPLGEAAAMPEAGTAAVLAPQPGHGEGSPLAPQPSPRGEGSPLDDRLLAAIISFIPGEGLFFKNEGGIRKKVLDSGSQLFPALDLELITGGLLTLGLFRIEGEGLVPDTSKLAAFKDLRSRDRLIYCAAGIYCWAHETEGSPAAASHLFRNRIRSLAALIDQFLNLIDKDRAYPGQTLSRYWDLLDQEAGGNAGPAANRVHFFRLLEGMEKTGLLRLSAAGYWTPGPGSAAHSSIANSNTASDAPMLAMDTAFSCIIYPGISFADALSLGSFALVRETGATVRFELTRESVIRGFDRGFTAAVMKDILNRLSGNRVPELLIWTLQDWAQRYAEVSLYEGIVLSLSEDRRYLAEAEPLASLITRTIAPGVYLLSADESREAAEALRKAGVDVFAQYKKQSRRGEGFAGNPDEFLNGAADRHSPYPSPASLSRYYRSADNPLLQFAPPSAEASTKFSAEIFDRRESLKEQFRTVLDKMKLPRIERDELAARIERRLVLSEAQLSGASLRYEKLEARGLDYVGKASIAKQAIASKSLVEVQWPHAGAMRQSFGIPLALEKSEGESVLVINPVEATDQDGASPGDTIRIPLGKISLLRRIKKSIFGE
ncbi:helicase [Spirochaetia bacterium]|nr:helicase [Spirochaetia bacterium]